MDQRSPRHPQALNLATRVVSRRHFLVSKGLVEGLFEEGQRLHEQERYSGAAKSWGQAALLQHGASHAFLSNMLIEGRPDVAKDLERGFELAAAGAAMGCDVSPSFTCAFSACEGTSTKSNVPMRRLAYANCWRTLLNRTSPSS